MTEFRHALQFLTRLPVGATAVATPETMGRSLLWYPPVGLLIGLILVLLAWVGVGTQPLLSAAIIVSCWAAITGALHLDGLADSADAWVGGLGDRERTLEIMKDPRCGPVGVVALVMLLVIKVAALAVLLEARFAALLVWIPWFARGVVVWAFMTVPYVREQGLGSEMAKRLPIDLARRVLVLTLVVPLVFLPWQVWLLMSAALALVSVLWRYQMTKRLQGFTGDTAGALVEVLEAVLLVVAAQVVA